MNMNYYKNSIKKTAYQIRKIKEYQDTLVFENKCINFKDYISEALSYESELLAAKGYLQFNDLDFEQFTYFFAIDLVNNIMIFNEMKFEFECLNYDCDENTIIVNTLIGDFSFVNCRVEKSWHIQ